MNIFVSVLICLLAAYGLWQIFMHLAAGIAPPGDTRIDDIYTVMVVRNREETIEGMIRSAAWRALSQRGGKYINDIVVLDLGSEDDTSDILQQLEREYDFLHVMNRDDYIDAVRLY